MITKFNVMITPYNLERTIHMYLPDNYYDSDERYPVIYMYDGHNLFFDYDATYGKSWGLKEYLDQSLDKYIVVGMECNHEGNKRLDEYCPYDLPNSHLGNIHGTGKQYMEWVVNELKPFIDSNYRTLSNRTHTMIAGSSMGGLMSIYSVVKHNEVFSKAACLSSAIGMCMDELKKDILESKLDPDTKVYLDFGSNERNNKTGLAYMVKDNLYISRLLNIQNASTYPYIIINGQHNEATWEKQIPIFMDYLWKE